MLQSIVFQHLGVMTERNSNLRTLALKSIRFVIVKFLYSAVQLMDTSSLLSQDSPLLAVVGPVGTGKVGCCS